jgi:hypothetical protein
VSGGASRRAARILGCAGAALVAALIAAAPAAAQEWRATAHVGRLAFDGSPLAARQQASFALGLQRASFAEWFAVSLAVPLEEGALWANAGAAKRLAMDSRHGLGLDLGAHGFVQRTTVDDAAPPSGGPLPPLVSQPGGEPTRAAAYAGGGGAQAMALAFARFGEARFEARGGVAAHGTSADGASAGEYLPAADARMLVRLGPLQPGVELRWWHERASYAGASARFGAGLADAWTSVGRWLHDGSERTTWSAGAALRLRGGVRLEASYQHDGYDPLHRSGTGSMASLGASVRLGSARRYAAPVPASYEHGQAVIRLRAQDVSGAPRIAGDFNDWQPAPMTAAGRDWTIRLSLEPGVYHYAFVAGDGTWFVPESTPGRRSDGMGGYVAVLVVSP